MRKLSDFVFRQGGAILALVLALSLSPVGLALAAGTIGSLDIIDGSVKTVDLGKASVTKAKLAKNSVNSAKIADGSIANADIANGAILAAKIGDGAINSAKIADGSIVNADIAGGAAIAASKINRAGLNADLLDGVDSAALVKNNTATTQTLAGNLRAPDFAYSSAKTGVLTIPAVSANIVGSYGRYFDATIYATTTAAVDWYAPVNLPDGATITGFGLSSNDNVVGQLSAALLSWTTVVASVLSTDYSNWHTDSTSTITAGQEIFDDSASYLVHVNIPGGSGLVLQSSAVKIDYTYTSPGN